MMLQDEETLRAECDLSNSETSEQDVCQRPTSGKGSPSTVLCPELQVLQGSLAAQ